MNERNHLLQEIRKLSFAIQEAVLYLDGHPEDKDALAYYHQHNELKAAAVAAYEEKYGPLTVSGNNSDTRWQWVCAPWPWEED